VSAIIATERKLAVVIWKMVVIGIPFHNPTGYLFLDQKRKLRIVKRIQKQISIFELKPTDFGFVTN
jgi:hypothetical protein